MKLSDNSRPDYWYGGQMARIFTASTGYCIFDSDMTVNGRGLR